MGLSFPNYNNSLTSTVIPNNFYNLNFLNNSNEILTLTPQNYTEPILNQNFNNIFQTPTITYTPTWEEAVLTYNKPTTKKVTKKTALKPKRKVQTQTIITTKTPKAQKAPPSPPAQEAKPGFWKRVGNWFAGAFESFNNFIEQPVTTAKNWFTSKPKQKEKISLTSATLQTTGNLAVKIIAMPLLAPLAVAGLLYTSFKPLVQYCKQA